MSKKLKSLEELKRMSREDSLAYMNSLSSTERLSYATEFMDWIKGLVGQIDLALNEQFAVNLILVARQCGCPTVGQPDHEPHGLILVDEHCSSSTLKKVINRMLTPIEEGKGPSQGVLVGSYAKPSEVN